MSYQPFFSVNVEIDREEAKAKKEVKKLANGGSVKAAKILAREIVRAFSSLYPHKQTHCPFHLSMLR